MTREKVLSQLRDEGYSAATYIFPPGMIFGDHSHGCAKKDSIISGRFLFRMGGEEVNMLLYCALRASIQTGK